MTKEEIAAVERRQEVSRQKQGRSLALADKLKQNNLINKICQQVSKDMIEKGLITLD